MTVTGIPRIRQRLINPLNEAVNSYFVAMETAIMRLPLDVERAIFELSAKSTLLQAVQLVRVAHRVKFW